MEVVSDHCYSLCTFKLGNHLLKEERAGSFTFDHAVMWMSVSPWVKLWSANLTLES